MIVFKKQKNEINFADIAFKREFYKLQSFLIIALEIKIRYRYSNFKNLILFLSKFPFHLSLLLHYEKRIIREEIDFLTQSQRSLHFLTVHLLFQQKEQDYILLYGSFGA